MDGLAYVEAIGTPWGWVWIDPQRFGHRSASYLPRWIAQGRENSGWNRNADGTFTSQMPIPVHGFPLDPRLPPPAPHVVAETVAPRRGPNLLAYLCGFFAIGYIVTELGRKR